MSENNNRVFLDYAAGAPVRRCAQEAIIEALSLRGNAGGLHQDALVTRTVLETARTQVAGAISAHPDEIVFTSGGTEGNNLCIRGLARAARSKGIVAPHIITTVVEHPSVKEVCEDLVQTEGAEVSYVPVDENGIVDVNDIIPLITDNTVLISVMHVNNEIGSVMPIEEIGKAVEKYQKQHDSVFPVLHADACQSGTTFSLHMPAFHVDMLTLNGAKLGGPSGSGAVFIARGIPFENIITGGAQENGIRPGTQSLISITGFASALVEAQNGCADEYARLGEIKRHLWEQVQRVCPDAVLNGSFDATAPQIINISFPGIDNEELVLRLDAKGISVATKSACRAREGGSSYVVAALGDGHDPGSALRFSFGAETTKEDIDAAIKALTEVIPLFQKESASPQHVSA